MNLGREKRKLRNHRKKIDEGNCILRVLALLTRKTHINTIKYLETLTLHYLCYLCMTII